MKSIAAIVGAIILTVVVGLVIADRLVTTQSEMIKSVHECIMESETPQERDACGEAPNTQTGLDDAGDADGDGIDMCILWAMNEKEKEACK